MASKYDSLKWHLASFSGSYWRARFSEVEGVLGFKLPKSAHLYPAWWSNEANGSHVHCHAWRDAGWQTRDLDLSGKRVTFVRIGG